VAVPLAGEQVRWRVIHHPVADRAGHDRHACTPGGTLTGRKVPRGRREGFRRDPPQVLGHRDSLHLRSVPHLGVVRGAARLDPTHPGLGLEGPWGVHPPGGRRHGHHGRPELLLGHHPAV